MSTQFLARCAILAAVSGLAAAPQKSSQRPDLTKVGAPQEATAKDTVTWALGPTGAHGWFWAERRDTTGVTQGLVTKVDPGSPTAKVLEKGDVILGVISPRAAGPDGKPSGQLFAYDARRELAAAITEAEKIEHGGKLVLNVWRKGKAVEAALMLPVMGTWSKTAPANCPKTNKLIEQAADSLLKRGIGGGVDGYFDGLGLLATGDDKYLPTVRDYAHRLADPNAEEQGGGWYTGFINLFLTEYYLASGDAFVLPAIKLYSNKIAVGQSAAGTWGHALARPITDEFGTRPGRVGAYGAINQAGLICAVSLVLAQKCGIENPVVDHAVTKAAGFFRFYADKGGVPYGDHKPAMNYSANGKTAAAAVLFDLLGEPEPTTTFAKMALASYDEMEAGHTGNYWSLIWGPLGAACSGDAAATAYSERIRWYTELERRWTGGMAYQGQLAIDPNRYRGWSTTGIRLMHLCLPRKKIYLTGRGGRTSPPLSDREVAEVVATGSIGSFEGKSTEELLGLLRSWSPVVRDEAAKALAAKEDDVVKQLVAMLDDPDRLARYGACAGLREAGRNSNAAVDALISKGLKSDDQTVRYYAILAFTSEKPKKRTSEPDTTLAEVAPEALPALLDMAIAQAPSDPLQTYIAEALAAICKDGKNLDKVDRAKLVAAIRSLLKMRNGGGRSQVAGTFYGKLSPDELNALWGEIYLASAEQAPSGEMFSDGVRVSGVKVMAEHGVKEGIKVGADLVCSDAWGSFRRIPGTVPAMSAYGEAMKEYYSAMRARVEERFRKEKDKSTREKLLRILDKGVTQKAPELMSIEPQIKQAGQERQKESQ